MARQKRYPTPQQVGRAGELFVAAELNRRGALATLYLTNAPRVDVVATSPDGFPTVNIQVKTKGPRSNVWQWDIRKAESEAEVDINDPEPNDFLIFVDLKPTHPDYYIWRLQDIAWKCVTNHRAWLKSIGGKRPRNPKSPHIGISLEDVKDGKNAWHLLEVIPYRP